MPMPVKTLKRSFQSFLIRPNSTLFEGYTYGTFFYRCVNLTDNLPFFFFYILPWQSSLTESDTLEVLDSHKVLHHLYFCCLHLKIDYSEFSGVPQNTVITVLWEFPVSPFPYLCLPSSKACIGFFNLR